MKRRTNDEMNVGRKKIILKCPCCKSKLRLTIGYSGCDWDTVAGEGSGYGWPIELICTNERCAIVYPLVHAKSLDSVSFVKPEYRNYER